MSTVENSKEAQKALRKREKRAAQERKDELRYVMADPRGRRFMYAQIFLDGCLTSVYLSADSGIYRHEGKREQAVRLADEIQRLLPDEYVLMITERLRDQSTEKQARSAADEIAEGDEESK